MNKEQLGISQKQGKCNLYVVLYVSYGKKESREYIRCIQLYQIFVVLPNKLLKKCLKGNFLAKFLVG